MHGFTTRELADDYQKIAGTLRINVNHIITLNQIHSNKVFIVTKEMIKHAKNNRLSLEGDALVTHQENIFVGVRTADCLPLLMFDPTKKVCAAVHAGWRGLVGGVIENTLGVMIKDFGSKPADILVTLGIALCENCFEVGPEVVAEFKKRFGEKFKAKPGRDDRNHISLRAMAIIILLNSGIMANSIELITGCTSCNNDKMFSYRKGDKDGRGLSLIGLVKHDVG